jgi:hypothetical protein
MLRRLVAWLGGTPRWLRYALTGLVALLTVTFLAVQINRGRAAGEVRKVVAETDEREPGWRLEELEASRKVLPDAQNGALVVLEVVRMLPRPWPSKAWDEANPKGWVYGPLTDRQQEVLRAELDRVAPALRRALDMVDYPEGRYPLTFERDVFSTPAPHLNSADRVSEFLALAANLRAQDGDARGAARCCRALLHVARSFGDEPLAFSQLVRVRWADRACSLVEQLLAWGELSEEDLRALQGSFATEARHPGWEVAVRGERALTHAFIEGIERGDVRLSRWAPLSWWERVDLYVRAGVREDHRLLFVWTAELLEAARFQTHQRRKALEALDDRFPGFRQRGAPLGLRICQPDYYKVWGGVRHGPAWEGVSELMVREPVFTHAEARAHALQVALAVERFRRGQGRWPEALKQLVPKYIHAVPLDPYDGLPLRYRRTVSGVVLYSVGPNEKDDGGSVSPGPPGQPATDVGCRLLDVGRRSPAARP